MKFSDVVKRVIELATVIDAYWELELPKRHPNYPLADPGVPDPPPPPQEDELRQYLRARPAEEVYKLHALSAVGAGIPATEFNNRWQRYMKDVPDTQFEIELLLGKPLADNLTDGLAALSAGNLSPSASPR